MDITELHLASSDVIKTEFEDFKVINTDANTSGFMRIGFTRQEDVEANDTRLKIFFTGEIVAYQGEETKTPSESDRIFSYKIKFVLRYSGEFSDEGLKNFLPDNEWFFKKDASIYFSQTSMGFLSSTKYKNIDLPLQQ